MCYIIQDSAPPPQDKVAVGGSGHRKKKVPKALCDMPLRHLRQAGHSWC